MVGVEAHRGTMAGLADAVARVAAGIPAGAVLLDVPVYRNIGDLLIHRGTEAALAGAGVTLAGRFSYADLGKAGGQRFALGRRIADLDRMVAGGATLVFQGGGNLGDLWPNHQLLREALIARYRDAPCVILPQSAHFRDPAARNRCLRVFAAHPRLTIHCRDAETLALLAPAAACTLAPDMAHGLWGMLPRVAADARTGELVQARRDGERAGAPSRAFDWADCQTAAEVAAWRAIVTTRRLSAHAPVRLAGDALWRRIAGRWIDRAVAGVGTAARLRTDRLHGLILAALLDTPAVFADNSYGKLGRYVARWLADDPWVARCATPG